MANNVYPDRTVNYMVYDDGSTLLGTASVDLPEIQYMTDTLSGAGIAGEIETPVLGHVQSMSVTFKWNTILSNAVGQLANKGHTLTLRSSQEQLDTAQGLHTTIPVKIVVKTLPKSMSFGSFEPGAKTDSETELEITYIKIEIDNKETLEIDKLNFIFKVLGDDALSGVRSDLGL